MRRFLAGDLSVTSLDEELTVQTWHHGEFGGIFPGTLLAETKLSNRGVGFLIINAYSTFNMPRMYALLIVLFVLSIGVNALVGKLGGVDSIRRA